MRYLLSLLLCSSASASIYNLKIVTDANPDYTDLPSLVHSATSKWTTPEEKCWAMFYWNHIARRQTMPIELHGMALTDPIRQFNDYGYTMCSTISGINQSIWEQMGLKHRYWDISNHTVSEVFYDGRWHMYDNSLSALYTLCDGKTLAGVEDIGKEGSCEKSGNKKEPGHIAKYHCLTATSPNGFLTGADTIRSLDEEYRCFNPNGLKLRTYFYDWDNGHRYIHNLRPGETYTRMFASSTGPEEFISNPEQFIPNSNGKDPEEVNPRYHLRGNGAFGFRPILTDEKEFQRVVHATENVTIIPGKDGGLAVAAQAQRGSVIFKVATPNVMTWMRMDIFPEIAARSINCFCSTDNGHTWVEFKSDPTPFADPNIFIPTVNGAYEALIKIELNKDSVLKRVAFFGTTALNSKTLPRLNLGKNTIYVGAGEQTDSIVLWPELHGDKYKQMIVQERNVASTKKHNGYQGTLYPTKAKEDGYIVYRIDAPRDLTRLTYGGRFYNRAPKSHIDLLHSLDNGQTWTRSWSLTDTAQPWDVIHYETVNIPAGHRSVLIKYLMNSPSPSHDACSIYAIRMEANHQPADTSMEPLEVTFYWKEGKIDRSHRQLVEKLPFKYIINVAGNDHPEMNQFNVRLAGADKDTKYGYFNRYHQPAPAGPPSEKFVGVWQTLGKNLATGEKYTLSKPSQTNWDAGDPDGRKLTDGVMGPSEAGGISYRYGAIWNPKTNPTITLDLGEKKSCASFGLNFHGYPGHNILEGKVKDRVEVQISDDGEKFTPIGHLQTDIKRKDIPVNFMLPDDEHLSGYTFRLIPPKPASARYVRYLIFSDRHFCATDIEVLDSIELKPFDLRIALPDEKP